MLNRRTETVPNADWNKSKTLVSQVTMYISKYFGEIQEEMDFPALEAYNYQLNKSLAEKS